MGDNLQNHLSIRSHRWQSGQGLVEYGLILVLVAVAVIAILTLFGGEVNNVFSSVVGALGDAM